LALRILADAWSRCSPSSSLLHTRSCGGSPSPAILLFDRILGEDRSLLELLSANYTHLTHRLAKFYQIEDQVKGLDDNEFHLVEWPDNRRAGVIGLGRRAGDDVAL